MSKLLTGVLGLVVGLVLGVFLIGPMITGAAAGIGIATGLSAGICSTVEAAQEEGLLTAEQVDHVLLRAAQDMAGAEGLSGDTEIVGSAGQCDEVYVKAQGSGRPLVGYGDKGASLTAQYTGPNDPLPRTKVTRSPSPHTRTRP